MALTDMANPVRSAVYPIPARLLPAEQAYALDCPRCRITGHPLAEREAIVLLAQIHDRMVHGRGVTATVVEVSALCEICGQAPASLTLPDPDPDGGPFSVCSSCALDPTGLCIVELAASEVSS